MAISGLALGQWTTGRPRGGRGGVAWVLLNLLRFSFCWAWACVGLRVVCQDSSDQSFVLVTIRFGKTPHSKAQVKRADDGENCRDPLRRYEDLQRSLGFPVVPLSLSDFWFPSREIQHCKKYVRMASSGAQVQL